MDRYRHRATGSVVLVDDGAGAALGEGFERIVVQNVKVVEAPTKVAPRRTRPRKTED